ncbi:hypothetical protein GW17_00017552 [Ensete ventricosum]|nr:hypothetical protein GW17_00017552 [Ensete ventricosum]
MPSPFPPPPKQFNTEPYPVDRTAGEVEALSPLSSCSPGPYHGRLPQQHTRRLLLARTWGPTSLGLRHADTTARLVTLVFAIAQAIGGRGPPAQPLAVDDVAATACRRLRPPAEGGRRRTTRHRWWWEGGLRVVARGGRGVAGPSLALSSRARIFPRSRKFRANDRIIYPCGNQRSARRHSTDGGVRRPHREAHGGNLRRFSSDIRGYKCHFGRCTPRH